MDFNGCKIMDLLCMSLYLQMILDLCLKYAYIICVSLQDKSPDLTEEQLLCLLDECELTEIWSQDVETNDTTP